MIKIQFQSAASVGIHRKYPTRPYFIRMGDSLTLTIGKWWVTFSWGKVK